MNKSRYFSHDIGARNDPKLITLQMEMKGTGLAIWWCLLEMLYENDGYLPMNSKAISFSLRWARPADVERVINDFGLFENDGERFWSPSALDRIQIQRDATETASNNARKASRERWKKDDNADAMQAQCESNADAMQAQCESNADAMPINKYINKDIKENIYIKEKMHPHCAADIDTDKILENFFFKNIPQPAAEVQRFINHYAARGWKLGDGNPVADVMALAENWKPEKQERRFSATFLKWYHELYINAGRPAEMLTGLADGELLATRATLRYQNKALAIRMRDLLGPQIKDREVDWKFNN